MTKRADYWLKAFPHRNQGFTLIELIIVVITLAIAALGIATQTSHIFDSQDANKTLQVGLQLMNECAEKVLATSRAGGFATTPVCNQAFTGFSPPAVTTISPYTGAACPGGSTCKLVTISISPGSGGSLTPITLLLVGP